MSVDLSKGDLDKGDDAYFLAISGQRTGPFPRAQVQEMWRTGIIPPRALFWRQGTPEWLPIGHLVSSFGGTLPPPVPLPPGPMFYQPPPTSGLAIGSFILALLSVLLFFTCIPAVILGHVALSQIKKSAGRLGGYGLAVAGLVIGYFFTLLMGLMVLGVLAGVILPMFSGVQERGQEVRDLGKAKQLGLAIVRYEGDHEGTTPPDLDALFPKYLQDRSLLNGSPGGSQRPGFDYLLPNTKTEDVSPRTVMLRSLSSTRRGERVLVYADGSAELSRNPYQWESDSPTPTPH